MGFPSPASDYVEGRLTVNSICNVGPNTLVFEQSGGYVVLDISLKPKQGSQVLIQHGVVTFTICDVRSDNSII
ncbi:hypothetical protein [Klebsiella pneumoniae]|uniref:hypothetical protein n=1 Tax=Klebsiella pneumoniae TaxID=573 RepID=UPI0034E58E2B